MPHFAKRVLVSVLGFGLILGVAACGKKAAETPPPAAPAAEVSVTGVELGRSIGGDKRVTDKTTEFGPKDVIYASVLTTGASPSAVLKAQWTFEDGQVVNASEQPIAPTGDAATEFHISKADGWPAGKYKVEVFLNGSSVKTADFQVK